MLNTLATFLNAMTSRRWTSSGKDGSFAAFFVAALITLIFYYPCLRNGSSSAGFLYSGDVLGWYWPALIKTHQLLYSGKFYALDFSTYNASSDFFLSPNFFSYHPFVVLYSMLVPFKASSVMSHGRFLVFMATAHSFLACYFSIRLFHKFFSLEFLGACVAAVIFSFSCYMVFSLGQLGFLFGSTVVPWAAYAALRFVERPTVRGALFGALPTIFAFTCGYVPLGAASLVFSTVLILMWIMTGNADPARRLRTLAVAAFPYIVGTAVILPYIFALKEYHKETISGRTIPTLFYAAHQLADTPQTILRMISNNFLIPGKQIEFWSSWGAGVVSIFIAFIFGSRLESVSKRDMLLIKISLSVVAVNILAVYGTFSALSDAIYYFVPIIGDMHIYQRFFVSSNIFLGLTTALILRHLIVDTPRTALRIILGSLIVSASFIAYCVALQPAWATGVGLTNGLIVDLLLAAICVTALLLPGKNFAYLAAIVTFCLPSLGLMYGYSRTPMSFEEQSQTRVSLNTGERNALIAYMKGKSGKDIIKYVDITPMWENGVEPFSKVFPYFVLNEINLSSYGGFTFYLSSRAAYMDKMPINEHIAVTPSWRMLIDSGADFVVAMESDLREKKLPSPLGEREADVFHLRGGAVVLPLAPLSRKYSDPRPVEFDNGYLRLLRADGADGDENVALGKSVRASRGIGDIDPGVIVDGNTDGDFSKGTVYHSVLDKNAWAEVDLGKSLPIDYVKVWGRTDCCSNRLDKFWIFVSDTPFSATDTADDLRRRADVSATRVEFAPGPFVLARTNSGTRGRYVRLQFTGERSEGQEYLALSEFEVHSGTVADDGARRTPVVVDGFETDSARYLKATFTAQSDVELRYLLSSNPRMVFRLDGKVVSLRDDGIPFLRVPAGRHVFEAEYRNAVLRLFWLFYFAYGAALLLAATGGALPRRLWDLAFKR